MAEGRMLKRVISTSPRLAALKNDTHRLIYTWLIPFLDREGRFSADARIVKGNVAPLLDHITTKIIDAALRDMAVNNLIVLYEVNGNKYLQLQRFEKHQNIRKDHERASDIPAPLPADDGRTTGELPADDGRTTDNVATRARAEFNTREYNIREEKAAGGRSASPPKTKYLDSVLLSENEYKKLQEVIGQKNLDVGIEKLDYSITVKNGKYKDHYKALLNWHKRGYLNSNTISVEVGKESNPFTICPNPNCKKEILKSDLEGKGCIACVSKQVGKDTGLASLREIISGLEIKLP